MIKDLIKKNRSYRRFVEGYKIDRNTVVELIGLARSSASAANLQPLKYLISNTKDMNDRIYPYTKWAGYLKDWDGPKRGERPSAYIIILGDRNIRDTFGCDHGIAAQSILLGASEKELGGCMIGSIDREELRKELSIPDRYKILLIIALGKPNEKVVLESAVDGNIEYYRDDDGIHHVPKRPLEELIFNI